MIAYLLTLTLVWAVGLTLYFALLRRVPAHGFNRGFLLTAVLAGLLVPLLPNWGSSASYLPTGAALPEVWLPGLVVRAEGIATSPLVTSDWTGWLLLAGYATALVALIASLARLAQMHLQSVRIDSDGDMHIREVRTDIAPCSFGRNLYVRHWGQLPEAAQRTIITHESAHYRLGHAFDTSVLHVVCALLWWHPLAYVLRRELRLVHEFQADARTVRHIDDQIYRTTLLTQQFGAQASAFAASFNHSPLNLRFMMLSSAFRQNQLPRLVVAALALTLVAAACTKESVDEGLLEELADVNTERVVIEQNNEQQALYDALVEKGVATEHVDTVTVYDPVAKTEEVTVVRYYKWASTGKPLDLSTGVNAGMGADGDAAEIVRGEKVYKVVEEMPRFPAPNCADERCAQREMLNFIYSNITYPAAARDAGVEGTSVVSFVVGRDGELVNARIERSLSPETDLEVLRIVNEMPAWEPGKQAGQDVQVRFNLPIKFKLAG